MSKYGNENARKENRAEKKRSGFREIAANREKGAALAKSRGETAEYEIRVDAER